MFFFCIFYFQYASPCDEESNVGLEKKKKNEEASEKQEIEDAAEDFKLRLRKELVSRDGHGLVFIL